MVPLVAAMAVVGIARAQPEPDDGVPMPPDGARLSEQYVIPPGAEQLFLDALGSGQVLPGGCTFSGGEIGQTSVLGTYTCDGGQVVLQLLRPEKARPGAVRTQRFAIAVRSGAPPAGLVEAIAERVGVREGGFEWKHVPLNRAQMMRRAVPAAAIVAVLVFWALFHWRATRR